MPPQLGNAIKRVRQAQRLTLHHPAIPFDIEVHPPVPAPRVLRELARVLELDDDALLALAGAVDTLAREYLVAYP